MRSILVIDDEPLIRKLLADFFGLHGYEMVGVGDGKAGIDLLKQRQFDLFFVDISMPGMGGIDVLREVKALDITSLGRHHGVRLDPIGRGGGAARRVRLHHEAVQPRRAHDPRSTGSSTS